MTVGRLLASRLGRVVVALGTLGLCLGWLGDSAMTPQVASAAVVPSFNHVFVIVFENTGYDEVFGPGGATRAPYFNQVATQGVRLDQMYGTGHASLPNYIAMISGHAQQPNTSSDCPRYNCVYPAGQDYNLTDQLEGSGRTWKGYMDSMPLPCTHSIPGTIDPFQAPYATRHNPFMYYSDIVGAIPFIKKPRCAANDVPYKRLAVDLANNTVPNYAFITPDTCHDAHDSPCYPPYLPTQLSGVPEADLWLSQNLPPILNSAAYRDRGVVLLTFDEGGGETCCGNAFGGRIPTVVLSPLAKSNATSAVQYSHFSMLRTVEQGFGLPCIRHACDATTNTLGADVWLP